MMPAVSPDPSIAIESMTDADWPVVRHIYQEGIATGDATLEREAPDWDHFDRSHRRDCRLVARFEPGGHVGGWVARSAYSARRVYSVRQSLAPDIPLPGGGYADSRLCNCAAR